MVQLGPWVAYGCAAWPCQITLHNSIGDYRPQDPQSWEFADDPIAAAVVGPLDATLDKPLEASIKRSIPVEPPVNEIETITVAVVDFQTSALGSRNGEVHFLEFD